MDSLKHRVVNNFWDALKLREIRNDCREFMTNDKSKISLFSQIRWYFSFYQIKLDKNKVIAFLFYDEDDVVIGYGLARWEGQKVWLSGGLKKGQRGRGYGTRLFKTLVELYKDREIWLEVLDYNTYARKIYKKLGFRTVPDKGRKNIIVMKRRKGKDV